MKYVDNVQPMQLPPKNHAAQYLAKLYIYKMTGIREGTLTLSEDKPGLIEYTTDVHRMKAATLRLDELQTPWRRVWFEHTSHYIAYHYELNQLRKIVLMHRFGSLKLRIQLIDDTEVI